MRSQLQLLLLLLKPSTSPQLRPQGYLTLPNLPRSTPCSVPSSSPSPAQLSAIFHLPTIYHLPYLRILQLPQPRLPPWHFSNLPTPLPNKPTPAYARNHTPQRSTTRTQTDTPHSHLPAHSSYGPSALTEPIVIVASPHLLPSVLLSPLLPHRLRINSSSLP